MVAVTVRRWTLRRRTARRWLTVALLLAAGSARAAAQDVETGAATGAVPDARLVSGELAFDANSSVGRFSGTTHEVEGEVQGGSSPAAVRGWVEFAARSLRTGIGQRDRHMWESLEAEAHPRIRLDVERVEPTGMRGDTVLARVHGHLTVRGVRRPVVADAEGWRTTGGFQVRGRFPLDLGDFQIGGLRRMFGTLRVREQVTVRADLAFAGR